LRPCASPSLSHSPRGTYFHTPHPPSRYNRLLLLRSFPLDRSFICRNLALCISMAWIPLSPPFCFLIPLFGRYALPDPMFSALISDKRPHFLLLEASYLNLIFACFVERRPPPLQRLGLFFSLSFPLFLQDSFPGIDNCNISPSCSKNQAFIAGTFFLLNPSCSNPASIP